MLELAAAWAMEELQQPWLPGPSSGRRGKHSESPFATRSIDLPGLLKIGVVTLLGARGMLFSSLCAATLDHFCSQDISPALACFLNLFFASYTQIAVGLPSAPPGYKGTCCERARSVTSLFSLLLCQCAAVLLRADGRRCQFFYRFRTVLCQVLEAGPSQC